MYKVWINEATGNIKTHYQNKLEKKEIRVKAFYRNKDGKINNTTIREIKEPKKCFEQKVVSLKGTDCPKTEEWYNFAEIFFQSL